jgi:CubicO group peptidase (beta-lactamase class C family)
MRATMTRVLATLAAALVVAQASCGTKAPATAADRLTATDRLLPSAPAVVGMDRRLGETLDTLAIRGIRGGAAPGMSIAVGRYGRLVHLRGYGSIDWAPGSAAVTDSTVYDLASLTKAIATATAAMILEEDGRLAIERPVHDYLPELTAKDKRAITIRMLLTHSGGFEAGAPLYKKARGQAQYLKLINARKLAYPPGTQTVYSDWDMVVLQAVIERIARVPLDVFVQQRVFGPLRMRDTRFRPDTAPAAFRRRIAPTSIDSGRGGLLRGIVNDENAWALGGVAGHAGLFSSARDLALFAQLLLNGGEYAGVRILRPETIAVWTARQSIAPSRALAWDTPAPGASSGRYFSTRSFGHTGFTGTSLWIDPDRGVFVVLLMNRINSHGANERHLAVRRDISDAVQSAILDAPLVDWEATLRPTK